MPARSRVPAGVDPLVHIIPNVVAEKMPPVQYQPYYMAAAHRYGVPVDLLVRQGWKESRFDTNAVSPEGERGIAQLKPEIAAELGVDTSDVESSIHGQARRMSHLYGHFPSWPGAAAAYDAGQERASQWRQKHGLHWPSKIPSKETQDYLAGVEAGDVVPPVFPQAKTMLPADAPYQPWNAPISGNTPFSRSFGGPRGRPRDGGVHAGQDIPALAGTPITMPMGGRVVSTRRAGGLYGHIIDVELDDGSIHRFAHLGQDRRHAGRLRYYGGEKNVAPYGPGIEPGAQFEAGQVIGYVGGSGTESGWPHIHTEVFPTRSGYDAYKRQGRTTKGRLDPRDYWQPAAPPNIDEMVRTVAPPALPDDVTLVPATTEYSSQPLLHQFGYADPEEAARMRPPVQTAPPRPQQPRPQGRSRAPNVGRSVVLEVAPPPGPRRSVVLDVSPPLGRPSPVGRPVTVPPPPDINPARRRRPPAPRGMSPRSMGPRTKAPRRAVRFAAAQVPRAQAPFVPVPLEQILAAQDNPAQEPFVHRSLKQILGA